MVTVSGATFCCLCLKTNPNNMMQCVECLSAPGKDAPSSFCSASCFQVHFQCHRGVTGVMAYVKRPSSGSSSSGSDPGSPPSSFMHGRGMLQHQQLSPLPMGHYQQQQQLLQQQQQQQLLQQQQQQQQQFYHHPSPPSHRRGSGDGRHQYQQQRSRRA